MGVEQSRPSPGEHDSMHIRLANPEEIREQSGGEVTSDKLLSRGRPKEGGLFCERIFGEERVKQCPCGKPVGKVGGTCKRCGLLIVLERTARLKKIGHIDLKAPVVHPWFYRLRPSPLAVLLDLRPSDLEQIVAYEDYVVLEPGEDTRLKYGKVLKAKNLKKWEKLAGKFQAATGADAIRAMLQKLEEQLEKLAKEKRDALRAEEAEENQDLENRKCVLRRLAEAAQAGQEPPAADLEELAEFDRRAAKREGRRRRLVQWLQFAEGFLPRPGGPPNQLEWMVLDCLPVIPPDLRPYMLRPDGTLVTDDLNLLYQNVLRRNQRLAKFGKEAPEAILREERRLLQWAVEAVLDNSRLPNPAKDRSGRNDLQSLTAVLEGKHGIFRRLLLGKRVDFSARSVIVVESRLKLHQCGLPRMIALELYRPFLVRPLAKKVQRVTRLSDELSARVARMLLRGEDKRVLRLFERHLKDSPDQLDPVRILTAQLLQEEGENNPQALETLGTLLRSRQDLEGKDAGNSIAGDGVLDIARELFQRDLQRRLATRVLKTLGLPFTKKGRDQAAEMVDELMHPVEPEGPQSSAAGKLEQRFMRALEKRAERAAKIGTRKQQSNDPASEAQVGKEDLLQQMRREVDDLFAQRKQGFREILREIGREYAERPGTLASARALLTNLPDLLCDLLEPILPRRPVLLNRGPSSHRMNVQAFEPVLVEGKAIRLHPLVCASFGADFDGDTMAVHLPLSIEAQTEAYVLMMSTHNIFSPANGLPIISPRQDIVLGCYYLTATRGERGESSEPGEDKTFANVQEVLAAYDQKKLGVHARIYVRLPIEKKVIGEIKIEKGKTRVEEIPRNSSGLVFTTVGRVLFNDILHPKMAFYDLALSSKQLMGILIDCYLQLGKRETVALLDRMKDLGFREATRSGLSIGPEDLATPASKQAILEEAEKRVQKLRQQCDAGQLAESGRYNKVIEAWDKANDDLTKLMMEDLRNDHRKDETGERRPYLNPVYLMAHSGARGGTEQIRQLAGMRGLMAKPNGAIIETPIKANFREGLSPFEYFLSIHGSRKSLADKKLLTPIAGELIRNLVYAAQGVVVTSDDCHTTRGVPKRTLYRDGKPVRLLEHAIEGRVSRDTVKHGDTVIVRENEIISAEQARLLAKHYPEVRVRSPMTCEAPNGICRHCYGTFLASGPWRRDPSSERAASDPTEKALLAELGLAVGVVAAQSIGEVGGQLTMKGKHTGGVAQVALRQREFRSGKAGTVQLDKVEPAGPENKALGRAGRLRLLNENKEVVEEFIVPYGAKIRVNEGQLAQSGELLCEWDPDHVPILARKAGFVRFVDLVEGETVCKENLPGGGKRWVVLGARRHLYPQVVLVGKNQEILASYHLPGGAHLSDNEDDSRTPGEEDDAVTPGEELAWLPQPPLATQDIGGSLAQAERLFYASKPPDAAVLARVDGRVQLGNREEHFWRVWVQPVDERAGPAAEHRVPHGKPLLVETGDFVRAGDPMTYGEPSLHDLLDICGADVVGERLVDEIQRVYCTKEARSDQRPPIDDRHVELLVAQMLRGVRVTKMGDTELLPGTIVDKFVLAKANEGKRTQAAGVPVLRGIHEVPFLASGFLMAAGFQRTVRTLRDAALAGRRDDLTGLCENVMLGRLIPAGPGFPARPAAECTAEPASLAPPVKE